MEGVLDLIGIADVALNGEGFAAELLKRVNHLVGFGQVDIEDGDVGAFLGEGGGDGLADAAGGAGDDGRFLSEFHEGDTDECPVHRVHLDAFYMDVYAVTNAQYAKFLNQYGKNIDDEGNKLLNIRGRRCLIERSGDIYRPRPGYENHPVVEVTWHGAAAYARFHGKRLPTEAEWEKAARGGLARELYPCGDQISHDNANYAGIAGRDEWYRTCPVNSFAPNSYGLYNMAGNVYNWCADWYAPDYYTESTKENPQGPDSGFFRVIRGGGWNFDDSYYLRAACRSSRLPSDSFGYVGFRCVSIP